MRSGFHSSSTRGSSHGPGRGRGRGSMPKVCKQFHRDECSHGNCSFMHAWSSTNDLSRLCKVMCGTPVFAAAVINETQVAIGGTNGSISIWDLSTNTQVASFASQVKLSALLYTPRYPDGSQFLFFGGMKGQAPALGFISNQNNQVNIIPTGHTKVISAIEYAPNGYIFVAGEDCNIYSAIISIWFLNGTTFEYGTNLTPNPGLMLEFTCLKILNNYILASTKQGIIFVWMFDFNTNSSSILGNIPGLSSSEAITAITVYQNRYILSAGLDGTVHLWDSGNNFAFSTLLNTAERKKLPFKDIEVVESRAGKVYILVGGTDGTVSRYELLGDRLGFRGNIFSQKGFITKILKFNNSQANIQGFVVTSKDPYISLFNLEG